jgi:hypothetical protein
MSELLRLWKTELCICRVCAHLVVVVTVPNYRP